VRRTTWIAGRLTTHFDGASIRSRSRGDGADRLEHARLGRRAHRGQRRQAIHPQDVPGQIVGADREEVGGSGDGVDLMNGCARLDHCAEQRQRSLRSQFVVGSKQ
jgi:hypothetical protein